MGISLNHAQRFMPGQMHHVVERYSALDQTRSKRVTKIMKTEVFDPRFPTSRAKGRLHAFDRLASIREYRSRFLRPEVEKRFVGPFAKPNGTVFAVFRIDERYPPMLQIDILPIQTQKFRPSAARIDGETNQRLQMLGGRRRQAILFFRRNPAGPGLRGPDAREVGDEIS